MVSPSGDQAGERGALATADDGETLPLGLISGSWGGGLDRRRPSWGGGHPLVGEEGSWPLVEEEGSSISWITIISFCYIYKDLLQSHFSIVTLS